MLSLDIYNAVDVLFVFQCVAVSFMADTLLCQHMPGVLCIVIIAQPLCRRCQAAPPPTRAPCQARQCMSVGCV